LVMTEVGLVVARYRRHVAIEAPDGQQRRCLIRGRQVQPLVGDEIQWHAQPDGTVIIDALMPRRSTLTRIDSRGRREGIAANLSQLVVVTAPEPAPDWVLVDRYLLAAEFMRIEAVIVWNKQDLANASKVAVPPAYARMGYRVAATSTKSEHGLEALSELMRGERSTLVGQSGVGKSSLINALLGSELQTIGGLTAKGAQGRHTTSTAVLYRLPGGGTLIDSPGVRDFAPYIDEPAELENGYREFQRYLGSCKFDDCLHLAEPDCAIKHAVAAGSIAAHRYESYCGLYALTRSLAATRSRGASKR
jgi:ribosome biogenesis GTPase / thiamine phosphate phosphatase